MTYNVIQSGSSGNCLIINDILCLDCGVTWKKIEPNARALQFVFAGHSHADHFCKSTIKRLAFERPSLRFAGGPHVVEHFIKAGVNIRNIDVLEPAKRYNYGAFQIEPFELFHDVPNMGLKIFIGGEKALYAVDTGHMSGIEAKSFDYYFFEANHEQEELEARAEAKIEKGEFAYEFRAAKTHLSKEQALDWLYQNMGANSRYVLLHGHEDRKEEKDGERNSVSR